MFHLSRTLTTLLLLFIITQLDAQTKKDAVEDFKIITKHTGNNYKNNPNKPIEDTDTMYVVAAFKVNDWSKVAKVYLKLGSKADALKKGNLTIDVKNPKASLPAGTEYWTKDDMAYIRFPLQKEMKKFSATLVTEDASGNKAATLKSEKE